MTPKEAQDKLDEKLVQARPASTADLSPTEIRIADAGGRLVVDPNGYGTVYPTRDAAREAEQLAAEPTAAAPADRVLHCWTDEREHAEAVHGRLSPQWTEVWSRDVSGTCMLPQGHDGPHQFTPDDQIDVTVAYANPHPSGCHTAAPGERDCYSDGHASCSSCSRRTERDEEWWREGGIVEPAWPAAPWPSDDEERASMRAGRNWDP